jgi:hypothetical protein
LKTDPLSIKALFIFFSIIFSQKCPFLKVLAENNFLFSAKTNQKSMFWLEIIFYFQPKDYIYGTFG